jgi:5'-methylthioadenosine phosphorylase
MVEAKIGVIGGSGLYGIDGMRDIKEADIRTPFGEPSDTIHIGTLEGVRIAFLPRHARGHKINPTNIQARANIWALKSLGVEKAISVSAVGSLKEEIKPGDLVIPDQIIDRTKGRIDTFFTGGIVVHVSMADPYCAELSKLMLEASRKTSVTVHMGGTYIAMEGPQFSTRAESNLYRSWGASVIGMTALPEAKLAREAEMCYTALCFATDYDCWRPNTEDVTAEIILTTLRQNVETSKEILKFAVPYLSGERKCNCNSALRYAIATSRDSITLNTKKQYSLLIDKYVK